MPGRASVIAGSHIDTVRNGGWLDGIYGVCGAFEVLETLSEHINEASKKGGLSAEDMTYNYEVVIFAEEEGSNFGSTMTGSKFVTGFYKESDLDKLMDDDGRTLRQRLISLPVHSDRYSVDIYSDTAFDSGSIFWDFDNIKSMLELHIEQGPSSTEKVFPSASWTPSTE